MNKNEQFAIITLGGSSPRHLEFYDWLNARDDITYLKYHEKIECTIIMIVFIKDDKYNFKKIRDDIVANAKKFGINFHSIDETTAFYPRLPDNWREKL